MTALASGDLCLETTIHRTKGCNLTAVAPGSSEPEFLLIPHEFSPIVQQNVAMPCEIHSSNILKLKSSPEILTMGLIGCLPDNVQQGIKSFSIRSGSQHITFAFPFMEKVIRKFACSGCSEGPHQLSDALFFDQCAQVVNGFQTFVTMAPNNSRTSMSIVALTLYEANSLEGLKRHFESVIRALVCCKMSTAARKLPVLVTALEPQLLQVMADVCSAVIQEVDLISLHTKIPPRSPQNHFHGAKEEISGPYLVSYSCLLELHMEEVMKRLPIIGALYFQRLVSHLRSVRCTPSDYSQTDMFFRRPEVEPVLKAFWSLWSQYPIASKVFPVVQQMNCTSSFGSSLQPLHTISDIGKLGYLSIKEGIYNIIKCLKSEEPRDFDQEVCDGHDIRMCVLEECLCNSEKRLSKNTSGAVISGKSILRTASEKESALLSCESAFHRPAPRKFCSRSSPYLMMVSGNHWHSYCPWTRKKVIERTSIPRTC